MLFAKIDIGNSVQTMLDRFFEAIPVIALLIVVLIVGYIIAKMLAAATRKILHTINFNTMIHDNSPGDMARKVLPNPADLLSKVVYWIVMIGVFSVFFSILNVETFNTILEGVYGYMPNVLAAILIFVVAGLISAGVGGFASRVMGDTATGKIVMTVVPAVTMSIAFFMILNQLKIAPEIVTVTYTAIMGALALGLALAFGLGGREVAAKMLNSAYEKGTQSVAQAKVDMKVAKHNTKKEVRQVKQKARR